MTPMPGEIPSENAAEQGTITIQVELPPREKVHLALGVMTWNFAALEATMQLLSWLLISDDPSVGQRVTFRMSLNDLARLLERLVSNRDVLQPDDEKKLLGILRRVDGMRIQRNQLIHSTWLEEMVFGEAKFAFATLSETGKGTRLAEVSPESIRDVARGAFKSADDALDLLDGWIQTNPIIAARAQEAGYKRAGGRHGFSLRYQFKPRADQ